jgi:hypothetical protein
LTLGFWVSAALTADSFFAKINFTGLIVMVIPYKIGPDGPMLFLFAMMVPSTHREED